MTKEQRKAVKRICAEYDFENFAEFKKYMRETFNDPFEADLWDSTEEGLYKELTTLFETMM